MAVPVNVAVVVDGLLVREGLVRLLAERREFEMSVWRSDEPQLLAVVVDAHPDVVIVDEAAATVDFAFEIAQARPRIGLIVLSRSPEADVARALLEGGVSRRGYLLHDTFDDLERFQTAIRKVAAGGSEIDPRVVEALVERRRLEESPLSRLRPREAQVLAQVASGKSNAAIATTLGIEKRSVEHQIHEIFPKLDLPEDPKVSRRVAATLSYLRVSLARERAQKLHEQAVALHAQALMQIRRGGQR